MNIAKRTIAIVLAILISACTAAGPKFADTKASIPATKADAGRIFFYRSSGYFGGGIRPSIKLNGTAVGDSKPGGFFYVDTPPGSVEIVTTTEVDKKLTFEIAAGETRYVRTSVGLGVIVYRVYPELVDNNTGAKEIEACNYTGTPQPR